MNFKIVKLKSRSSVCLYVKFPNINFFLNNDNLIASYPMMHALTLHHETVTCLLSSNEFVSVYEGF